MTPGLWTQEGPMGRVSAEESRAAVRWHQWAPPRLKVSLLVLGSRARLPGAPATALHRLVTSTCPAYWVIGTAVVNRDLTSFFPNILCSGIRVILGLFLQMS